MAELFLGKEPTGQPVVIKRILPHLARQSAFVAMFIDEARIGSLIHHPNLVEVFELGQVGDDLFLVMEYLEGENLSGLIRRFVGRREQLDYALAAHVIAEACLGLHAAHTLTDGAGKPLHVVHRDVSPQNIFVTYGGGVKVLDFGVAIAAHRLTQTETGQLKGKFSYMSPEQIGGEAVDARSDLFSLGVVLYELTLQRRLFKRANELLVLKAVTEDRIPLPSSEVPGYPDVLEAICMKALARDRDRRYASALEMHGDLVRAMTELRAPAQPGAQLGRELGRVFRDRIDEKRSLVKHVRAGTELPVLPSADVDEDIEIPQVSQMSRTPIPRQRSQPSTKIDRHLQLTTDRIPRQPPRRPWLVAVAGVGVLALAGAITAAVLVRGHADPRAPTAPAPGAPLSRPAVPPVAVAIPVAPVPVPMPVRPVEVVVVSIETRPPGATVFVDQIESGTTPGDIRLPRGDAKVVIDIVHAGFVDLAQTVVPDRDQRLVLVLTAEPKHPVGHPVTPKLPPKVKPKDGGFHRFE